MTDHVAARIYEIVPLEGMGFAEFRGAIGYSNIIEPRNSEWNVVSAVRTELSARSSLASETVKAVHAALLSAASEGDPKKAGWETPHYLFTDAGLAFHSAALGKTEEALRYYSKSAIGGYDGNQWLAANFAVRQEAAGLIPSDAIETLFLRAMVWFRTGRRQAALPLLRRVANSERSQHEVAISLHIVANDDARRRLYKEAEAAYKRSIEIGRKTNHAYHVAQAEHSLANMYAKQERFNEAEAAYKRSIAMRGELNDLFGLAQTEHSLANMYAKQERFNEAEAAYKRSIEIGRKIGHAHHVAQTEHSLASMYAKQERYEEAETLFEHSLGILRVLDDKNGIAQTLRSRGLAIGLRDPARAMRYFTESLRLNEAIRNPLGIRIVRQTIARFRRQSDEIEE
ncbi:MAG TPA: tetratricopeptide repeat protein [Allosphingosinicella sp.]|nr:tetratricopeptide repeat protein [Allosphingosinicella sp.]